MADAEGFDRKRRKDLSKGENINSITVVRNRKRRARRLSLEKRVERKRRSRDEEIRGSFSEKDGEEEEDVERLVREYSVSSMDLVTLDWKKMKIPPVLSSSEQARLFKLMQPMKVRSCYDLLGLLRNVDFDHDQPFDFIVFVAILVQFSCLNCLNFVRDIKFG